MFASRDFWLIIPNYPIYEINPYGSVRRRDTLRVITQMDKGNVICVNLAKDRKQVCKSVGHLVAEAYLRNPGGKPVVWHKNGLYSDNFAGNLEWITRSEFYRRMAANNPRRKPVQKVTTSGEVVEIYSSIKAAAQANYLSNRAVFNRCHGDVEDPFQLDGHNYVFET